MHRFFLGKDQIPIIAGSDVHHIKDVLRMKVGNELELLDGSGKIYNAKIAEMEKDKIICEVLSERVEEFESKIKVTLAQCLPKAKKMDLIIQKCTELGAHKIIPTLSERSVSKGEKLPRWRKIVKEAAEQSGRSIIPEIAPLTPFEQVLKLKPEFDLALIPWELERETSLKKVLTTHLPAGKAGQPNNLLILIGPEGGFSRKEIELAKPAGFTPLSLGPRILRTETAAMVVLSIINYEYS